MNRERFLVFGAGSWGSALAIQLFNAGNEVFLTSFDKKNLLKINTEKENKKYLPGVSLPKGISIGSLCEKEIERATSILVCVKSTGFKDVLTLLGTKASEKKILWATKGFDPSSGSFLSAVAEQTLGKNIQIGVISGPTFAEELATGKPAALTLATRKILDPVGLATSMSGKSLRVYTSKDMLGVQFGGGFKNIIAIAAGISDSLGLGANARSALITRGLEEMKLLGVSYGAEEKTFFGLSGLGDIVLSSTDNQSRNRALGKLIGSGKTLNESIDQLGSTPEGANAIKALVRSGAVSKKHPIAYSVYSVLFEGLSPLEAAKRLMDRPIKDEH